MVIYCTIIIIYIPSILYILFTLSKYVSSVIDMFENNVCRHK